MRPVPTLLQVAGLVLASALMYSWAAIPTPLGAAVAWVALVPMRAALEKTSVRLAIGLGALFGFLTTLALSTVMWPVPGVQAQQVLVPAAILALYPALWGSAVVLARQSGQGSVMQDCIALAAWIVLDYIRANVPVLAFPLGTLAQTQVDNLPLIQIAAIFGEPGVTALVVLGNLAVWRLCRGEPLRRVALRATPVVAAAVLGGVVLAQSSPGSTILQVAALHTNFPSFGEDRPARTEQDRLTLESLKNVPAGTRVLLAPETAFVNLGAKPELLRSLHSLADSRDLSLVLGVAQAAKFERANDGGIVDRRLHAGLWIFRPQDTQPERYEKTLRVPFAEYVPPPLAWATWLVGDPVQVIPGSGPRVFTLPTRAGGVSFGAMVCWEGLFAAHARQLTLDGAQVLFQVSNEGWFAGTSAGVHHNAAVRLRAVESGRWVLLSSNAGPAEVIDAHGRVIARSAAAPGSAWVPAHIETRAGRTIYTRVGDLLILPCMLLCLWAAMVFCRKRLRLVPRPEQACSLRAREFP